MIIREVRFPRWVFPAAVLLLTALPLIELGLLIALGRTVGLGPALLICAATGFGGAWLARADLHPDFRIVQPDQRLSSVTNLCFCQPGDLHRHRRGHRHQLCRDGHRHAGEFRL